jgi:outer membrane protein assembly factor BamB
MATLEVHDGQGRVEFVELARDHPVLFGTSAACDIVLAGEGISLVHGRIRWRNGRFKVEASPAAQYVLINGHKMASSSLHQGDEMTVGPCRLFMLRLDDSAEAIPTGRRSRHRDEEKTRVLEGTTPLASRPQEGAEPRRSKTRAKRPKVRESILERDEWLEALELDPRPEAPVESLPAGPTARKGLREARPWGFRRWLDRLRSATQVAPGQEKIVSSPLVLALVLALALLVLLGISLRAIISKTMANQGYNRAVDVLQDGDYRTAIRDFDAFLASYPQDPRAGKARVLRALANVRQYVSISGGTWSTALEAAHEMFEGFGNEPEFRDERVDLAELVIRIGEGLADRARHAADEKALREAESAVPLHAAIAGEPAPAFLKRSRLPGLLDEARAAVRKAHFRRDALAAMDLAVKDGSAPRVYKARDALVERYADLAQDRELIARMTQANDLVRRAVKVEATRRDAASSPRPETLGPPVSLVLRSPAGTGGSPANSGAIVYALADGMAYGLDAASGEPLWQRPVGLASPFVPEPVQGESSVLVVDAAHDELLRLDGRTGRLLWRLRLGEPVDGPPLVLGDQLYQILPSGKLLAIDLRSGQSRTVVELGMPLSRSPVGDEMGRFLYVVARRDCLFVLARDPLACAAVEYLGHEDGSIPCTPARLGRFLIIPENDRPGDGRWRVLVLDEDGARVRPVPPIGIPGWTWATPPSSGSVIWAAGDKGGVEAYALGDYASKTPVTPLARMNPDAAASGPAFGLAVADRKLWLAAGVGRSGRYELDPERGELSLRSVVSQSGPAVAALQATGRHVVATFQDAESGGTLLLGVDRTTGAVSWRTVLGAAWPFSLEPARGGEALRTIGRTGQEAVLPAELLSGGGFVTLLLPQAGTARVPSGRILTLEGDGPEATVIVPGTGAASVWVRQAEKPAGWREFDLPTACAAMPLAWGRALLIPGVDGRAYLIDPITARSAAEPLVPVYDRDRRGAWLSPVKADASAVILADESGKVRRLGLKQGPVPRLNVEAEIVLDRPIVAGPTATGQAVMVITADRRVRALSVRDLSPVGAWPLEAPPDGGPVTAGGHGFVFDTGGGVLALGGDGRRLWSARLGDVAVGPPVVRDGTVWILDRGGHLEVRAVADGSPRGRLDLGILPAGGMFLVDNQIFVPISRGTIQGVHREPIPARGP